MGIHVFRTSTGNPTRNSHKFYTIRQSCRFQPPWRPQDFPGRVQVCGRIHFRAWTRCQREVQAVFNSLSSQYAWCDVIGRGGESNWPWAMEIDDRTKTGQSWGLNYLTIVRDAQKLKWAIGPSRLGGRWNLGTNDNQVYCCRVGRMPRSRCGPKNGIEVQLSGIRSSRPKHWRS